jgi:hypothetical protein
MVTTTARGTTTATSPTASASNSHRRRTASQASCANGRAASASRCARTVTATRPTATAVHLASAYPPAPAWSSSVSTCEPLCLYKYQTRAGMDLYCKWDNIRSVRVLYVAVVCNANTLCQRNGTYIWRCEYRHTNTTNCAKDPTCLWNQYQNICLFNGGTVASSSTSEMSSTCEWKKRRSTATAAVSRTPTTTPAARPPPRLPGQPREGHLHQDLRAHHHLLDRVPLQRRRVPLETHGPPVRRRCASMTAAASAASWSACLRRIANG